MSLLIKALQKAEDEKKSDAKAERGDFSLSLEELPGSAIAETISEPQPEVTPQPVNQAPDETQSTPQMHEAAAASATTPASYTAKVNAEEQQKQVKRQEAATMLSAKTSQKNPGSTKKGILLFLVFLALAGFGGIEFYSYLDSLNQPNIVMAKPPVVAPAQTVVANTPPSVVAPLPENTVTEIPTSTVDVAKADVAASVDNVINKMDVALDQAKEKVGEIAAKSNAKFAKPSKSEQMAFGDPININPDTAIKVTKNATANRVSPDLASAYQAFNAGDDATAQRSYRQVLKNDIRNTDALLGMAAVAMRQGRVDDAIGWYGKVLEIEPRNTIAQSAMISATSQVDPVASESRIKNMITQQPESAYLYAALGSIYADQGAWPQAQQAYFQAFHFDADNAEYAFNLAVSLDQLGKPTLALQYYKQALELVKKTGNSNIDRTQLESRISQLN